MTATTRPKLRWILLVALSIASIATAAEAIARWAGTAVEPTIVTASVLEAVTVTVGDLTSTERIDGTIEETQSITVLHRIEGQSSASTPTQPSTQDSATDASAASNVSPVGLASFASSVNATQADTVSVDAAPEPGMPSGRRTHDDDHHHHDTGCDDPGRRRMRPDPDHDTGHHDTGHHDTGHHDTGHHDTGHDDDDDHSDGGVGAGTDRRAAGSGRYQAVWADLPAGRARPMAARRPRANR